jgi:nitrite reductase/ring-hydroxylating ferredoxin subunit
MRFHPLEKLINLHDNYIQQFKIDNLQLLLIQRLGQCYLIEAYCPHRGHALATGTIGDGFIQCALHQYRFALDMAACCMRPKSLAAPCVRLSWCMRGMRLG